MYFVSDLLRGKEGLCVIVTDTEREGVMVCYCGRFCEERSSCVFCGRYCEGRTEGGIVCFCGSQHCNYYIL